MFNIIIKQHDITDCGAACLASVTVHYKLEIPKPAIAHVIAEEILHYYGVIYKAFN